MNILKPIVVLLSLAMLASPAMAAKIKKKDQFSYAIGFQIGNNLKMQGVEPNTKVLKQAIDDAISGKKPALTMKEMQAAVQTAQQEIMKKRAEKGEQAMKEGKEFLAKNKTKKGVTELKSGVQYQVLKAGKGDKPTDQDMVVVDYKGSLIDGTEFDSSYKRGQPATFGMNQIIRGWKEILPLMPMGSKWKVVIPSDLAYGSRGAPSIGPNETLVFEIELKEIKKGAAAAAGAPHPMQGNPHKK